ncbi:MAG: O-linked N-acetylglucosamine transferase, SPINDLY family protein, partial [Planctomycetota bacterium]
RLGHPEEAERLLKQAIELEPEHWEVYLTLGGFYQMRQNPVEALRWYEEGRRRNPRSLELLENCAALYNTTSQFEKALEVISEGLVLDPKDAKLYNIRGMVHVQRHDMKAAVRDFLQAIELDPALLSAYSNYLFYLHYADFISPHELAQWHRRYGEIAESVVGACSPPLPQCAENRERIRIGYVSGDFRQHSVAFFFEPLLKYHDRGKFEIYCYSYVVNPDAVTGRIRESCDVWRNLSPLSDQQGDQLIRNDHIDILVDLAGHTAKNRLPVLVRKPAPVLVTWLGYPDTTGVGAIDYRLTDAESDPEPFADELSTERLIRLTGGFHCFAPIPTPPSVAPPPARVAGFVTFGSFNNFNKVSPTCMDQWAAVLAAVPGSHLLVKAKSLASEGVRNRFLQEMGGRGVESQRITLLSSAASIEEHLATYHRVDIALDTYPYHGTTTTFEALYMGVPVLTVAGATHAARVGVSILTHAGLTDWIAEDEHALVELACQHTADLGALAELRSRLRAQLASSPLMDQEGFVSKLEDAYREMWARFCASGE